MAQLLPWITGVWLFVQLLSLRLGLLNRFFFDTLHAEVQAIDYYSLPKAWLNLASGRSLYATFDPPAYGPHFTWYLAHPLFAVVFGWPLSRLDPADSYGVFTLLSLAVMAACASLLARESTVALTRRILWLLMLGAFPTFATLYVGNVQAFPVLGLTLLFVGLLRVVRARPHAERYVSAGLLVSLFSKPVVLLMMPLLLLLGETHRAAVRALAVYLVVSLLFLFLRPLNPEPIGLSRILWLAGHPAFVRAHMQIYANGFRLTPDMRDNSIHWFNLVAQSGFRLHHIDVVSLPLFLDDLFGARTPDWVYLLPPAAVLVLSFLVPRKRDEARRRESASLLTLAASLSFFLSYPTVWEYQYTAVLPVAAITLLHRSPLLSRRTWAWCLGLAACAWLPSLYFLSGTNQPTIWMIELVRLDHVVPVSALFCLLLWEVIRALLSGEPLPPSAASPRPDYSSRVGSPA